MVRQVRTGNHSTGRENLSELMLATELIDQAFQELNIAPWDWLNSVLHNAAGYGEHPTSEGLRSHHRKVAKPLGWGRGSIPDEQVAPFIVATLGFDILRYPPLRRLLVERAIESSTTTVRESLMRHLQSVYGDHEQCVVALFDDIEHREWRPSTPEARAVCDVLSLPSSFAIVNTSGELPEMEMSEPIQTLSELTDFQRHVVSEMESVTSENRTAMLCMPTGAGKTRTTVEALLNVMPSHWNGGGILWIADRQELCEQAVQTFLYITKFRAPRTPIYRVWGGRAPKIEFRTHSGQLTFRGIAVTSTQQLRRRLHDGDITSIRLQESCNAVVIDEAHRNLDWLTSFVDELRKRKEPPAILGLSATPSRRIRNETAQLTHIFDEQFITPIPEGENDFTQAIEYLQSERVLAKRIDVTVNDLGVELESNYTEPLTVSEAFRVISNFAEKLELASILVFAESVQQSKELAVLLTLAGYPTQHLDGSTPTNRRANLIEDFRENRLRILTNFDILTTGFDAPKTDGVVILRATEDINQPLITQMIGRGLRGPRFGGTDECHFFIRGAAT